MNEEETKHFLDTMCNASIERLKEKGRVGMINACLRIKMMTENRVKFALESEKGVGTMVQIRIPLENEKEKGTC